MWKRMWTLFHARNKEYYRDRSALGWNLLFPFLVIIGFSMLFSEDKQVLYKVGVVHAMVPAAAQEQQASRHMDPGTAGLELRSARGPVSRNTAAFIEQYKNFKNTRFIEFVEFNSSDAALEKLLHHRLDLVIDPVSGQYWVSRSSPKGYVVEKLLFAAEENPTYGFRKQSITGREVPYIEWLFPGILGMNMMFSALFGVGYVVVRYRKNGALKRLSVTPVTPFEFLTAQVISRMFLLMVTTTIVYIGCALLYGFQCQGSYAGLFFVFALGGFSMVSLALLIASRSSSEEFAGGILNILSWPMMFLSEVWFSLEGAKPWVQKVSKLFPLTYMIDCARKITNDGAGLYELRWQILVLTLMSAFFLILGSLLFKWQKS